MLSYVAFVLVTWHAITAGTDMTSRGYGAPTIMILTLAAALGIARLITLRTPAAKNPTPNKSTDPLASPTHERE